jgi:uncharacterized FlgJ-related protein
MVITKRFAIGLLLNAILPTVALSILPSEAQAWAGYPGAYPAYPYAPTAMYRPPVMPQRAPVSYRYPAYPTHPVYSGYPGYAYPRAATVQPPAPPAAAPVRTATNSKAPARNELPLTEEESSTEQRKRKFIDTLLPLVTQENERLLNVRRELADLQTAHARGRSLSQARLTWLQELADQYRVDTEADTDLILDKLLKRIDAIPAGLAIAQAANESAWGRSRFAQKGKNLFGIWTYEEDQGMKPQARDPGKTHLVRSYDSLEASVRGYMLTLNSHPAYQPMRERRAAQRERGQPLSALQLAEGLTAYSEQGDGYIDLIQSMIRSNQLEHIAPVQLADAATLAP